MKRRIYLGKQFLIYYASFVHSFNPLVYKTIQLLN